MWFVITSKGMWVKRNTLIAVLLVLIAFGRVQITNVYDTSININTLNNVYRRIFTDPERITFFHKEYEMPLGPFVEKCRDEWVGVPCLGYGVLATDPETRTYILIDDEDGFIQWVKNAGQAAYLEYIIIRDPLTTLHKYHEAFYVLSWNNSITYMTEYLGMLIPENEPNNLVQLQETGNEVGFFAIDPLTVLHSFLLNFGFSQVSAVGLYALVGWFVLINFRPQTSEFLPLAISLLCCSLGLFFLTFFGDGMEIKRHVFPCFILLTLGGVFYALSLLELFVSVAKKALNPYSTREST